MNYSINIHDKLNPEAVTVFEFAEKGSLRLRWNGSNSKLENIIGSDLSFSMEVTNFQDAYFKHLTTYDERRYPVTIQNEDNNTVVWTGHLLPDQQEEPFTSGAFFVNFVASCGLGSLKGQYLPDDYYREEKTLIDIVSKCLEITALELPIYVTPALENKKSPLWNAAYIDTAKFIDGNKKEDAYDILNSIMVDQLCVIFQSDNAWYIYGFNKRIMNTPKYQRYNAAGKFVEIATKVKGVKNRTFLGIPTVGTHAPRKSVAVNYKIEASQLPEALYKVKNDGYTLFNEDIEVTNYLWSYTNADFTAKYNTKNGLVYLAPLNPTYSASHYVELQKQFFVQSGTKIKWEIKATTSYAGTEAYRDTIEDMVLDGLWQKILRYDIYYTNPITNTEVLLFSNENGPNASDLRYQIPFGTDRKGELEIEMIAPATAYYNIRFYRPVGSVSGIKTDKVTLDLLQASVLSENTDRETYTNTIKEFYSVSEDIEITSHDDLRYLPHVIRLEKINQSGTTFDTLTIFSVVTLHTAEISAIKVTFAQLQLVMAHPNNVTIAGEPLFITGKIYNYLGSDEFYVTYNKELFGREVENGENVVITLKKNKILPTDIADWSLWADAVYGVSFKRYSAAATDVLRNLFTRNHPLISATAKDFLSIRDFVNFKYDGDKVFYPLDIEWRLDEHETEMILAQNFYGEAVTQNLPPVVDAGPDIFLDALVYTANLSATASDPDGTIVSVLWQWVNGTGTPPVITDPTSLDTTVTGLTRDLYEFMVTVTDNVGLTAFDIVRVARVKNYTMVLTNWIPPVDTEDDWQQTREIHKLITFEPALNPDHVVRITANVVAIRETPAFIAGLNPTTLFTAQNPGPAAYFFNTAGSQQYVFLHRQGVFTKVQILAKAFNSASESVYPGNTGKVYAKVQLDLSAEIIAGASGAILAQPVQLTVDARK